MKQIFRIAIFFLALGSVKAQWKQVSAIPSGVSALYSTGATLLCGLSSGGLLLGDISGGNWRSGDNGLAFGVPVSAISSNASSIFLAQFGRGVYRSSDTGRTWLALPAQPPSTRITTLLALADTLFVGTEKGIFRFEESLGQWREMNVGLPPEAVISALLAENGKVFAGTASQGVYKRAEDKASWAEYNSGLFGLEIRSLASVRGVLFAGTSGGVYRMAAGGKNWQSFSGSVPPQPALCFLAVRSKTLAGTSGGEVYSLIDNEKLWVKESSGLPSGTSAFTLVAHGDNVFLANSAGLWRRTMSEAVGVADNISLPEWSVFPNPASSEIFIVLNGEAGKKYRFSLESLMGVETGLTGEGILSDKDKYQQVNIQTLPSGVYWLMVEIQNKEVRRTKIVVWR